MRVALGFVLGAVALTALGVLVGRYGFPYQEPLPTIRPAVPRKILPIRPASWDPAERQRAIDAYLAATTELVKGTPPRSSLVSGYDWFSIEPVGAVGAEMLPVVLFRLLPELAKKYGETDAEGRALFGEPAEEFAKFGFWPDPRARYANHPLPMGFSWTQPSEAFPLALTVRTCGSCHTGRVRLDDGSIRVLVGAPNTEILLHDYDTTLAGFFARHLADAEKTAEFQRDILALVDEKSKNPNYFFEKARGFDARREAEQVARFKAGLAPALAWIKAATDLKLAGVKTLEEVAYARPNAPDIHGGPPGFIDSSGLGIATFVVRAKLDPKAALFDRATKNDVPAVWNQRARKQWQWDGNIRDVLARNLVAALGLVGLPDKMDIQGNVFISDFIDGLPPAPYPFPIEADASVVERGRGIFNTHCVACHRHHQIRGDGRPVPVFNDLGTDPNRAQVVKEPGYEVIKAALVACYQPEGLRFVFGGRVETPNAGIDGEALLVKRFTRSTQGYVAPPLDGIWARAPYLHNGSVPTLRHLLAPALRHTAETFVRGSIAYDRKNVGWVWEAHRLADLRKTDPSARLYDTREDGQSSGGHDQPSWEDVEGKVGPKGQVYRLSWEDPDDPEVEALLAYLKTL